MSPVTNPAAEWDQFLRGVAAYRRADPSQNILALQKLAATAQELQQGGNPYERIAELEAEREGMSRVRKPAGGRRTGRAQGAKRAS